MSPHRLENPLEVEAVLFPCHFSRERFEWSTTVVPVTRQAVRSHTNQGKERLDAISLPNCPQMTVHATRTPPQEIAASSIRVFFA
jgi:hypothetical protein